METMPFEYINCKMLISFLFKQYQDLGGKNCQKEIIDKQQ